MTLPTRNFLAGPIRSGRDYMREFSREFLQTLEDTSPQISLAFPTDAGSAILIMQSVGSSSSRP